MNNRILPVLLIGSGLLLTSKVSLAASMAFYTASGDPGLLRDGDGNAVDVWKVEKTGAAFSELRGQINGNAGVWSIAAGDAQSSITQTHTFVGGALEPGQLVSIDYAHATKIAPGKRVGLRLLNADGNAEVELSFLGGGPGFERRDGGSGYVTIGKSYDPNHLFNVAFTITGPRGYAAVVDGVKWEGTFRKSITAIQVFNEGGGEDSGQMTDNLIVQKPEVVSGMVPVLPRPVTPSAFKNSPQIEARVRALLKKMTLDEKLGQLSQFSNGDATGPDNVRVNQSELAAKGGVGSILNFTGAKGVNELQRFAVEKSRLKIPILFGMDIIHGFRTVYPVPLALSSTWNPQIAEQCARMAAVEGTSGGIRWTFSPMVDIARDSRWGRITEGNGEDTYLGEAMAGAWVRGYQGTDLSNPTSMAACAKHFVAYGGAEGGREYNSVDISERSLRDVYLPPFKAAVDAGAGTFMSAFNTLGGVPTSANHHTLTDILRGEWGFRGFVVSDWNSIGELIAHGVALDGSDAGFKALTAGVDMDMSSNLYNTRLPALVKNGKLKMKVVDAAVERVLRLKFALGLFDNPYTDESLGEKVLATPQHLELARRAAEESFVLLKNEAVAGRPLLPLQENQTVALIGPLADSREDMLGAWNTRGNSRDVVSLRQSMAERLKDRLIYARGTDIEGRVDEFAAALDATAKADIVVMALGESKGMTGEAASRSTLNLPGRQLELLKAVAATGKPIVLVLFSGRPLTLPWEAAHIPAILEAWFPGVQAGPALLRTLYGEANPGGKLTASFPRSVGQLPLYYNNFNTGRPSKNPKAPGDGYSSAYLDEANAPLFPFGWGLSYTSFDYSPTLIATPKVSLADLYKNAAVVVEALVKNSGARSGSEVVQLYIGQRGTSVARPVRELKGFQKLTLAPGEVRRVQFRLTKKELAFWNVDMKQVVEPAELTVWVAPNSEGGRPAKMMLR
jgi:beta-glucosidase